MWMFYQRCMVCGVLAVQCVGCGGGLPMCAWVEGEWVACVLVL